MSDRTPEPILLHCGQCDDFTAPLAVSGQTATCTACGDQKFIPHDIARHLDLGETLTTTGDGYLAYWPAGD